MNQNIVTKEIIHKAVVEVLKENNIQGNTQLIPFLQKQMAKKASLYLGLLVEAEVTWRPDELDVTFSNQITRLSLSKLVLKAEAVVDINPSYNKLFNLPEKTSDSPKPLHEVFNPATIQEFRDTGLLFHINQILHPFGWALSVQMADGAPVGFTPARVRYRGFDVRTQDEQHRKIANYLATHAINFPSDIAETGPNDPNNHDPEITD